jgi:hypothetical protein
LDPCTPNAPDGLFESIEKDPYSKYHKIFLDTVGLDKIYDRKEIEKKKNEPEFLREYAGQYLGKQATYSYQVRSRIVLNLVTNFQ